MLKNKYKNTLFKALSIGSVITIVASNIVLAEPNKKGFKIKEKQVTINEKLNQPKIQNNVETENEKEISVIVEFNGEPIAIHKDKSKKAIAETKVKNEHATFNKFLKDKSNSKDPKIKIEYKIEHEYTDLFNGVSIKIKGKDVEKLLESDVVKTIWNNDKVQLELPKEEANATSEVAPLMLDSVGYIGADKLHVEGFTGKGVKVGVLDTGIDYNHPDLKDNYKGGRVEDKDKSIDEIKGWDFVDNDGDPMEATYEDWKKAYEETGIPEFQFGSEYYTAHGTHVSGTIAGTGENTESEYAITGVANEADLYVYRVLGPYGSGTFDDIVAGIEKAYNDGMDVINMSLGAATNSALNPITAVCNNAMLAGMVTVISNGNSGPDESTVGMPGSAPLAISVGASSVSTTIKTFEISSGADKFSGKLLARDFKTSLESLANQQIEFIDCGYGRTTDFEGKELTGKIALISRGELSLSEKIANAKNAGAIATILYNNVEGEIPYYLGESNDYIITVSTTKAIAEELLKATEQKVTLNTNGEISTKGDELADFSSRGPSDSEDIKPDIVAPGVSIISTVPEYINSKEDGEDYSIAYTRMSGTSMASPHIAAVAALIEQEGKNNGIEYSAFDVKTKIMNSGKEMDKIYAVNEIGTGRVDAYEAVHSQVSIQVLDKDISLDRYGNEVEVDDITASLSYKYIILEDEQNETSKAIDMVIKNKSSESKDFSVEVEYLSAEYGGNDVISNGVKIDLPQTINVNSNSEEKLSPKMIIPSTAELGLYQGFIHIKNDEKDYRIPFSARYTKKGFNSELSRVSISSEIELTGALSQGIHGKVDIMSPIERIDILVKEFDTNKVIGYGGSINTVGVRPGKYTVRYLIGARPGYYPVDESGNVDYVPDMLNEGKYKVVLQAINKDGDVIENEHPLLVDNEAPIIKNVNFKEGIYELNEKNMTIEKDENGNDLKAFWVKGNISDNSIEMLNSMGIKTSVKDLNVLLSYKKGIIEDNGDFRIPITIEDITANERPLIGGELIGVDQAISYTTNQDNNYTLFVDGASYVGAMAKENSVSKGQSVTVTLSPQNIKNASSMLLPLQFDNGFEVKKVNLTKEADKLLKDSKYKANISYNVRDAFTNIVADVKVNIVDSKGNPVNLNIDIPFIDVELKLVNDADFVKYEARLECIQPEIKDKDGNVVDITNTIMRMYDHVQVVPKYSSAMIQGNIPEGIGWSVMDEDFKLEDLQKYYWIEDAKGKKYDANYYSYFESFRADNLPTTKDKFKVVLDLPGHFTRKGTFSPYKIYNGNLISRYLDVSLAEVGRDILAGETNKDGTIDIIDAINVANNYGKDVTTDEMKNLDFNFDKKIDKLDMEFIVYNFGAINMQQENYKEPEFEKDGKSLEDILKEINFN